MYHTTLLVEAIQADRHRDFARVARERQLLDGRPRAGEAANRSSASSETSGSLSIGARRTGTSGPACEAL